MHLKSLHRWDLLPSDAILLQKELRSSVCLSPGFDPDGAYLIAGVDVSSSKWSPLLTAGVVVWDRHTGEAIERRSVQRDATFPYVPGLLSFREIPALADALMKVESPVDAVLVDGHGTAHPRRLGIAAHLALLLDVPTIGVAKSLLVGTAKEPGSEVGSTSPILDRGEVIGMALRTKRNVKPVFVSAGGGMDHASAVRLVLSCGQGYRLPEPTRLAHLFVNEVRIDGDVHI